MSDKATTSDTKPETNNFLSSTGVSDCLSAGFSFSKSMKGTFRPHVATLILLSLFLAGCGGKPVEEAEDPVRPIRVMKIGDIEVFAERSLPGRAEAYQEIDLAFRVTGPLVDMKVDVGDEVKGPDEAKDTKGDLIAKIDPRDFEVALNNAKGGLQRAIATRERTKVELTRLESALKTQAVSEAAVDRGREDFEVAKADVATFDASVKAAENALTDTGLRAPFDGTIVAKYVENFQYVRSQQMIVRLLDKSQIEFTASVPETLMYMAPNVKRAIVTFDAFPDLPPIDAVVVEIGREASATTRTFPVTVRMPQPEGVDILPGMAGRVRGRPDLPEGEEIKIIIPVTAVFAPEPEKTSFVWIIDESSNAVSRREIRLGESTSAGYIVTEGLAKGEVIATAGVHFLSEGQVVSPVFE